VLTLIQRINRLLKARKHSGPELRRRERSAAERECAAAFGSSQQHRQ